MHRSQLFLKAAKVKILVSCLGKFNNAANGERMESYINIPQFQNKMKLSKRELLKK